MEYTEMYEEKKKKGICQKCSKPVHVVTKTYVHCEDHIKYTRGRYKKVNLEVDKKE